MDPQPQIAITQPATTPPVRRGNGMSAEGTPRAGEVTEPAARRDSPAPGSLADQAYVDARVREVVERAPALSAEHVDRLRFLLPGAPAREDGEQADVA